MREPAKKVASAVAFLAAAIVIVFLIARVSGDGYTYRLLFNNAGQLVKGDDVQVGGRAIGRVKDIALTEDNRAEITVSVNDEFAPLHRGTTAVIRATSLSGIANRYIALSPGPNSRPTLPKESVLTTDQTTTPVDLDEVLNELDAPTRRRLQQVIKGSATQYAGKGKQANDTYKYLAPALSSTDQVVRELLRDQQVFTDFVVNSSQLVSTLAQRRQQISQLVGNASTTFQAVAAESGSLNEALSLLPSTVRKANTTFVNLRATLDDLDVLVAAAGPATDDLAPFLTRLRPLLRQADPTLTDLNVALARGGKNNDLIEAVGQLPALNSTATPAFADAVRALLAGQPVLEFIRPYSPELIGWLRDFGQGSAYYDANGHYFRVQPYVNNYRYDESTNTLIPRAPSQRYDDLQRNFTKPCPGAASQPPADGSAPFTDDGALNASDCNPNAVPEGP